MTPKFKVRDRIVVETELSKRYYVVAWIIDCWEWYEYVVEKNNVLHESEVRKPTKEENLKFYL